MNKEQLEVVANIRARHSYLEYNSETGDRYTTEEIGTLLSIIEEQSETLNFVQDDMEDLKEHLLVTNSNPMAVSMIRSTLSFLEQEGT